MQNAFWNLSNSDPHRAVSWDRLHGYSIGLFGDHLWKNFKQAFKDLGRTALVKVDRQYVCHLVEVLYIAKL